jgi:hypothetical protein
MEINISDIKSSLNGYREISRIYDICLHAFNEVVILDCKNVNWIDAHMISPLAAIIQRLKDERMLDFKIVNLKESCINILRKNGFMKFIDDSDLLRDIYNTTIPFGIYKSSDEKEFAEHIDCEVIGHRSFPIQLRNIREILTYCTSEIFNNAVTHSESNLGICVCGQLYPKKASLDYVIADSGWGFKNKIIDRTKIRFNRDYEYILWALNDRNTSRTEFPGGLGLKNILKYLAEYKGEMCITSNKGYVRVINGVIYGKRDLELEFPGAAVHLKFNPINI